MARRIALYSFAHSQHGGFSSFHQLQKNVPGARCIDITPHLLRWLKLKRRHKWETRWRKCNEYRLRPIFGRAERQCVHYLYPENSMFQGASWAGCHSLVLTCHQPANVLSQIRLEPCFSGFFEGLRRADAVVLLASSMLRDYESYCSAGVLRMIPHGVDANHFRPSDRPRENIVLTVGSWLRDYDCWAETVLRLSTAQPELSFEVIAKPGVVENARRILKDFPPDKIRFLHGISDEDLRQAYHRASVMFLPLQDAGANNAMLEAMASGLPILATDLPATREYGAECAWYHHKGDALDACCKLRLLLSDPNNRNLGLAARQRVLENYTWPLIGHRYQELYGEMLEARTPMSSNAAQFANALR